MPYPVRFDVEHQERYSRLTTFFRILLAIPHLIWILIWGIASFAIVPPLQMRVMDAASDAPNLASAMNIGAFNLGNAIGAALGGGVIGAGFGLPAVSLAGAMMASVALVMLLAFRRQPSAKACPA